MLLKYSQDHSPGEIHKGLWRNLLNLLNFVNLYNNIQKETPGEVTEWDFFRNSKKELLEISPDGVHGDSRRRNSMKRAHQIISISNRNKTNLIKLFEKKEILDSYLSHVTNYILPKHDCPLDKLDSFFGFSIERSISRGAILKLTPAANGQQL